MPDDLCMADNSIYQHDLFSVCYGGVVSGVMAAPWESDGEKYYQMYITRFDDGGRLLDSAYDDLADPGDDLICGSAIF